MGSGSNIMGQDTLLQKMKKENKLILNIMLFILLHHIQIIQVEKLI